MRPLTVPYCPTILDFGEKIGNLKLHPVEKQGALRGEPTAQGVDFAWNMLPSGQRLQPTPALPEQSQERWVMGVQVGGLNGGTAPRRAAGTSPRLRAKRKWRKDLQVPGATEEPGCHPVKKRAGAL